MIEGNVVGLDVVGCKNEKDVCTRVRYIVELLWGIERRSVAAPTVISPHLSERASARRRAISWDSTSLAAKTKRKRVHESEILSNY